MALRRSAYHGAPLPLAETMLAGRLLAAAGLEVPQGALTVAPVRPGDVDETGIAATRRGVDAAVGTRGGEHAERRHRDEFLGMRIELRTRLGDHARRWIGIELGEHAVTHCAPRLRKVVDGEQGGISEAVGWKGGGGFRYYRLAPSLLEKDKYLAKRKKSGLVITHTGYILDYIDADKGHVMCDGMIKCHGNPREILKDIKQRGYKECLECRSQ